MEAVADRPRLVVLSPVTGQPIGDVPIASKADVYAAVARARAAQPAWAARSVGERAAVLAGVRRRLLDRMDEVVDLVARESGKPRQEGLLHEVLAPLDFLSYYVEHAERILEPTPIALRLLKHRGSYVHYAPRGVMAVLGPWNFPVHLPFTGVMAGLVAGNAVVVKPSEYTPLVTDLMRSIYLEGGVPEDVLQVVHGYGDVGAAIIEAGVDFVDFIGSARTGRKVAAACGERLTPYVLELGGKAPALVLDDAPMARAIDAIVWGAFVNNGQACVSVERILVHDKAWDRFVPPFVEKVKALRLGDPTAGADIDLGPVANQRQLEVVERLIADATAKGARVLCGGRRLDRPGLYHEPTVITDATPDMAILNEEIFGPAVVIVRCADAEAMIAEANRTRHGLGGYVFTRDSVRGRALAERIEAGAVMVNDTVAIQAIPEAPWGGVKDSGVGFAHAEEGLRHLCQVRHVNFDLVPWMNRELWWFPYRGRDIPTFRKALGALYGRGIDRLRRIAG